MEKSFQNPEALHDVGQDKGMKVGPKFVNPGTPESPLVERKDITSATVKGGGAETLREKLIK